MLLRRYNLNYVPILRELLRTRSVNRTAENVGLSQSTVSGALGKLREMFEDELLVMVGRRLELTEKGAALLDQTERACLELETLVRPPVFDPSQETRRFVIATVDYVAFLIAPVIERLLAEEAPHASIHFTDLPTQVDEALDRGSVDVALFSSRVAENRGARSDSFEFFTDEMVVVASRRNRGFQGPLTREIYEASPHAVYQHSPRAEDSHEHISLANEGMAQRNRILVQQFLILPYIVERSDTLALVQRRLGEMFQATHEVDLFPPPFEVPPLELRAYWGRSAKRDPALRWLKDLLNRARPEPLSTPRPPTGSRRLATKPLG